MKSVIPPPDRRVPFDIETLDGDLSGERPSLDADNLISLIWRWRNYIMATAALTGAAAGVITLLFITPVYTATSQLMLNASDPAIIDIANVAPDTRFAVDPRSRETLVQSATVILKGSPLLESVVRDLKLDEVAEFNPGLRDSNVVGDAISAIKSAIRGFLRPSGPAVDDEIDEDVRAAMLSLHDALTIEPLGTSLVIEVSADSEDAALAAQIANKVVDNYIARQIAQKHEAADRATEWLKDRADKLRDDVIVAEQEIETFNAELRATGMRSVEVLQGVITNASEEINAVKSEIADFAARRDAIRRLTAEENLATVAEIVKSPVLNDLRQRLSDAHADIDRLEAQYGANPPGAKNLIEIRAQLMNRIVSEIDQVLNGIEALIAINEARVAALTRDLRAAERELTDQAVEQLKLRDLEREADSSRAVYNQFLLRLKEARERSGLQEADSTVVARAETPTRPSKPRVTLIALIFGVVGGAGMLTIATMRRSVRSTVITEADVHACSGLPVIGNIPIAGSAIAPADVLSVKVPRALKAVSATGELKLKVPRSLSGVAPAEALHLNVQQAEPSPTAGEVLELMCAQPFSALSEAVRWLLVSLLPDASDRSQVIMLTSAIPGEGKSTLSLLLARASAESGRSTLLIDADHLRNPDSRAHAILDSAESPGGPHGFDIIASELADPLEAGGDGARWLKNDALCKKRLDEYRARYQTIIVDAPPALSISDVAVIGRAADEVAIVCEWGSTPQGSLRQCVRRLCICGVVPRGVALNKVDLRRQAQETYSGAEYALNRTMAYYSEETAGHPGRA